MEGMGKLGRRIPRPMAAPEALEAMDAVLNIAVPNRVVERAPASTTTSSDSSSASVDCDLSKNKNSQFCEKPTTSATFTLPIILGIVIPLVGAAILFIYLQRRHVRKQKEEDDNDPTAALDFGLGDVRGDPKSRKGLPPIVPITNLDYREKDGQRQRQVSLDLSVDSPYLLPPELQDSRESLHSLSRAHEKEDPYRPVSYMGDGGSFRSKPGRDGSSIYTGSSGPSRLQDISRAELLANAGPMPRSPAPSANSKFLPPRQNSLPRRIDSTSPVDSLASAPPPYPAEPTAVHLQEPLPRKNMPSSLPQSPRPAASSTSPPPAARSPISPPVERAVASPISASPVTQVQPLVPTTETQTKRKSPPPMINTLPSNPRPVRQASIPAPLKSADSTSDYGDGFKITPPSPSGDKAPEARAQRYSMDVPPEEFAQAGLGAPGFDPRRISLTFRPLPPNVTNESEDPETRANRIRSFYKEYFDESKPAPKGQYYEDYDQNYLGDAAYFDPNNNGFVMPYAEPVTRRAMTPPPRGPRFQGPPRPRNGSMTNANGQFPPGPYPQYGNKAYSTVSGGRGPPKRPLPPPAALNTLPTPGKLGDDSFALMGAMEFAPPTTYRDRVQGRCDSPVGERRPYSPMVPSHTPLASAFEELAPMPSPHLLRKSGTFTGLDFAPPKKFRDPDSMSDAGSIRSNRSGVSAVQLGAIRNGAYRVSRIPQDTVFTKDDMAISLKPQWGMRPGVS